MAFLVVLRRTGPRYDPNRPVDEQAGWAEHASAMDALVADGVILLGGPLADDVRVVLAVQAQSEDEVRRRLRDDPWSGSHLVIDSIDMWTLRLRAPSCSASTAVATGHRRDPLP